MNSYYLMGLIGFATHMILKYWSEDGTFAENFLSARTLRYVIFTILLTLPSLILTNPDVLNDTALAGALAIGIAGGSMIANVQKVSGDRSPSGKVERARTLSAKGDL